MKRDLIMENTIIINKCGEEIHIDKETRKVVLVVRNGRNYKSARYLNNAYYWGIAEEYFAEAEVEEVEETCDLQDEVVNINENQIGRVVGMRNGKYRIVMSTGKLVELSRNEFYLDNEELVAQEVEEVKTIKVGHYDYVVFENEYVIRFTCKSLDRIFIYNKKYKDFKLMVLSTNRALLAKRYYNNYYNIISQLQKVVV
jgi:hypothetical protein